MGKESVALILCALALVSLLGLNFSSSASANGIHVAGLEVESSASLTSRWNKTYGGAESDFALALVQTVDGGYALAGRTYSFGAGGSDIWLVKTGESGSYLWNRTYGGTRDDRTSSLVQTVDGGFAMACTTYSFGAGSSDIWLVKTDAFGNHLWNRTYGGTREDDPAHFVVQTVDGGYALAGRTYSFGAGGSDIWLVKTDAFGNHLWNRTYGGTSVDGAFAFVQTADGGYALTGYTNSFGAGSYDFWLVKTDSTGNMVWNRTYGGTGEDWAYALVQTVDGGYAIIGETLSFGAGNSDVWLIRTDAFGNHLWNRTYGGASVDGVFAFVQTIDGGYALAGHTYSFGAGNCDAWLVKTDASGNHEWNETYGGIGEDYACRLVQTSDESYVLAGSTQSFGAGSDDFWLVRTLREVTTITVPDDYSTIQEAINSAIEGDVIFVRSGVYYEHVVVNKTISLVGEDSSTTIIDGIGTGHIIEVTSDNVNITGFTVQGGGDTMFPDFDAGVSLNNVRGCRLTSNNIVDNGCIGIHLLNSDQNTISGNNFTRNTMYAIDLTTSSSNIISSNTVLLNPNIGIGVHISSQNNIIMGNMIMDNAYGIDAADASNNTILNNSLANNTEIGIWIQDFAVHNSVCGNNVTGGRYCIKLMDQADSNTIRGNLLEEGQSSIQIMNARYTDIYNNTIAHNYGSDWDAGIHLEYAAYTRIRFNEITDNWRGIVLYTSSPYVSIYGNNVTSNEYGIRVAMGGSSYLNVSGNRVANNRGYGIGLTAFGGVGESNYATVARNLIVNNTLEAVGIGQGSNHNMIVQNTMRDNGHAGVSLERYSNYNTIVQNNMIDNGYGIYFDLWLPDNPSTQNMILNNNMINNTQQVRIVSGSVNVWNGSYASGGNYWSDYAGSDIDGDGFGDTPYMIDSNNIDFYPLMQPWAPPGSQPHEGDVNRDGKVDIQDIAMQSAAFGSFPLSPRWNPNCDINGDNKIDIKDFAMTSRNFGWHK